jgi:regulator of replication initiation timing
VTVVALLFGIVVGWIVGWVLTRRAYKALVSAIDAQNSRLLGERRESRAENERLKKLLSRADVALQNAKSKRDKQTQLIIDLTDSPDQESASA